MKSVLVTGSSGFIGEHLIKRLRDSGNSVYEYNTAVGDVKCFSALEDFAKNIEIDSVVHLAAKTFVPQSWETPLEFYQTNVEGTLNVLELCRLRKASLVYLSTYLYGPPQFLPVSEAHPINPNNPYAHSKHLAEQLCQFYADHYKVPVGILRPFNVYGEGQKKPFLIPLIVEQALNSQEIRVMDLAPKRDFVYVGDVVETILRMLERKNGYTVLNVGSGESVSVEDLIKKVQAIAGTAKPVISEEKERNNEVLEVIADTSSARESLGWEPATTLEEGLKRIIADERKKK